MALVRRIDGTMGLSQALKVLALPRSTYYYRRTTLAQKYGHVWKSLERIAREHPEYGYRRTTTELRERYGIAVNHKVVQRLHGQWGLALGRSTPAPRRSRIRRLIKEAGGRANLVRGLEHIGPFEVAYTDFSQLAYDGGTMQLAVFLEAVTKVVLGWSLSATDTTAAALEAWRKAKRTLRRMGASPRGMIVHSDRGSAFIADDWINKLLRIDGVRISYALNGAKDNTTMESFFGQFKKDNRSLFLDCRTKAELEAAVRGRMRYYNFERRHSSLGDQAPMRYARRLLKGK